MKPQWARAIACCALALTASVFAAEITVTGLQSGFIFTDTAPLAANTELMRRLLSPLAMAEARRALARSGKALSGQPIDPSQERFVFYVPPEAPPHGYALLVFVPPWRDAKLPQGWDTVLDRYGVIFVSAARSGNGESVLGRRVPLALIAEWNIAHRYPVDPQRVYIGGFSGGSRVAMRIALAYPDVFRGALLNAGADPLGGAVPLPSGEMFHWFQETTRLVYVTGENDVAHLGMAAASERSMREWCVFDTDARMTPRVGHEIADAAALSWALNALLHPVASDADKLAACRSAIEAEMAAQLQKAQALVADGKREDAEQLLIEIDRRYGGLASPQTVELNSELRR